MKTLTTAQKLTYTILFVLLASRLYIPAVDTIYIVCSEKGPIPAWLEWLEQMVHSIYLFNLSGSLFLIAIVITLNRDDLGSLNIDKPFIFVTLCWGLAVMGQTFPLGCFSAIAVVPVLFFMLIGDLTFGSSRKVWQISLVFGITFALGLLVASSFGILKEIELLDLFLVEFPFSAYEEVIFRGMLWMFLRHLNVSEAKVTIIQAMIFWISHISSIFVWPLGFWIFIPIVGLSLGIVVRWSRSITLTTIGHTLINCFLSMT